MVNNGSESGVSFTNMAPGEYTLLVKYYNSVFDKESDVYSLVIRIGDPWYASWWAYLIYALCLLLLAALLIRSFKSTNTTQGGTHQRRLTRIVG